FGSILGPQDCFLLLRGIKTLKVRMERQQSSAENIAESLKSKYFVKKVFYPGLKDHPGYYIHHAQSTGAGCVLSFEVTNVELAKKILKKTKICKTAVSLGGVETILSYPCRMSHHAIPKQEREKLGITDTILRLSVGLENPEDLIEDIVEAAK
ncbi:MAG TPA: PLP-dependent transferase, partial [Spirochaetota bacterium]|nr:PLP-dependent transferase [Spirochaetota bacterium]